jgi:glutathione synthase/RimK-type ligase-like ATP-grasp enzyme
VIDELRRRGISVFRFNTDDGEDVSLVSFWSETKEIEFVCDGKRIGKSEIAVGWCQQLPPYLGQTGNKKQCLQRENLLALQLATVDLDLLPIPWFNRPRSVLSASNKINQIVAARSVGLKVPATLVSNDPTAIRSFAYEKTIVAKNLATPWIVSHRKTLAAYTKIVDQSWLTDDKALSFAPVIYQEYKERKKDFRVVMIDDVAFTASCVPGPHQQEDIRRGERTGESWKACELDTETLQKLHSVMQKLQIDYCAADFMEDKNGNLFFLEVNTCGAWRWLDRLYDGTICNSIANALVARAG